MADKQIYVDVDVAAGDSSGDSWVNAYATLNAAETAEDGDITGVGVYYFHCKSRLGNPDTTKTIFTSWTTDATHYVVVQGGYAAGETGTPGTPEGLSTYSTDHYHMTGTDQVSGSVQIYEDYVRFNMLQVGVTVTANNTGYGMYYQAQNAGNDLHISNCIVKAVSVAGTGNANGIRSTDADAILKIWNTIVHDFTSGTDVGFKGINLACASAVIYNCTVNNCYQGIVQTSGTVDVQNCLVFESGDDFVGTFNSITYCATDDNHVGDSATNFVITQTADDYAALVTDADGGDYSVTNASSELYNTADGTVPDALFLDDIIVTTRGPAVGDWDIGAFELVVAGGLSIPIAMHHYKMLRSQ